MIAFIFSFLRLRSNVFSQEYCYLGTWPLFSEFADARAINNSLVPDDGPSDWIDPIPVCVRREGL